VKILLLHPEDSPRRGPWTLQKWDLIIDLGKSSESTTASWQELARCPVLRLESFRRSVEDPRLAGQILRTGFGQLLDQQGLDWWELTSLLIHSDLETAIALRRLVGDVDLNGELSATRPDWPINGLALLLGRDVRTFGDPASKKFARQVGRYSRLFQKLKPAQWIEIFWDKYDAGYQWRSRVTPSPPRGSAPVVLLPSAYTNVSRMAREYARLLPEQQFLLVATRNSGLRFERSSNVRVAKLAAYANAGGSIPECATILQGWAHLRAQLESIPELALLARIGLLEPFAKWFRTGLAVRDAWQGVFDREPVTAVLCGDDSNWYTRLPVIMARKRNFPTIDFHHGAFDGRFLLKELSSDFYLAKSEMERDYLLRVCNLRAEKIIVGAPYAAAPARTQLNHGSRSSIVFFSEPYESTGGRPEEVYRELMPALCRLSSEQGCELVLKLHPFENPVERFSLLAAVLDASDLARVKIVSGPLSDKLLAAAWFGITVESSTTVDCTRHSVPCFVCEWLVSTPYGYVQQYARFGVGHLLHSRTEVLEIPRILSSDNLQTPQTRAAGPVINTGVLQRLLAGQFPTIEKLKSLGSR
jgi:hypothetical protein